MDANKFTVLFKIKSTAHVEPESKHEENKNPELQNEKQQHHVVRTKKSRRYKCRVLILINFTTIKAENINTVK